MTLYFYQATDNSGKLIEGSIDAPDPKLAVRKIRGLNYLPIKVSEKKAGNSFDLNFKIPDLSIFPKVSSKALLAATQQLATLVSSGLTLDKSLSISIKISEGETIKDTLADIRNKIQSGSTLADALAQYPAVFSKLYINMVRAGEAGGVLGAILLRLSDFLEKNQEFKNTVRSASVYPLFLMFVGLGAVIIIFTVVLPKFADIFQELGQLPLPTVILLGISDFLQSYWWALTLSIIGLALAFRLYLQNETGKLKWDAMVLKLPLVGSLIRKIETARFSLTLSTLLNSGVPILNALLIVRAILGNSVMAKSLENLHQGLKGGKGISGPLQKAGIFPAMAIHMITVGEETGNLDQMLEKVSQTYEKEVELAVKGLISLIEPLMILIMAMVIGFIVIAILMAVFSINDIPL
jgi:general secretion pathway protein F